MIFLPERKKMKGKQPIFKCKKTLPVSLAEGDYKLEVKLLPINKQGPDLLEKNFPRLENWQEVLK